MFRESSDELDQIHALLVASAVEAGLTVVPGQVSYAGDHSAKWQWAGTPGEEASFVDLALGLGAKGLYAEKLTFSLSDLVGSKLVDSYLRDEDDSESPDIRLAGLVERKLKAHHKQNGQTYAINHMFWAGGVFHELFLGATWFEELADEIDTIVQGLKDQQLAEGVATRNQETRLRHERAEQLARDERYGKARNDKQRELIAEETFPDLYFGEVRNINAIAKYIYQDVVLAEQEQAAAQEAARLRAGGDSVSVIAAKLGLTKEKAQRLLYLADQDTTGEEQ